MKKALLFSAILAFAYFPSSAQKLDSILGRSTLSFNYGLSHDFFAIPEGGGGPSSLIELYDTNGWGQIFGFEYGYRLKGKNELGFGFSKQVHRRVFNEQIQTSYAFIELDEIVLRDTKNFHYLFWKRHFIEDRLIGTVGLYNLRYRTPSVTIFNNSDQTEVYFRDSSINIDFGIFVGLEYYHDIRNFQIGLRSRLFYTQGYSESFESFEFTPVLRFKL
jgi:hypothetical protein